MRLHVVPLLEFDIDVEFEVLYSAHMEAITRCFTLPIGLL
jgi:hypothetical protein